MHAMPRQSRTATDSSRKAHVDFTNRSRHVQEQFTNSSRLLRDSGARVGAWVYTGLPGRCSPFQRSPERRQLISQRQHTATTKQTKWQDLPGQNRGQKSCKRQPCIIILFNICLCYFNPFPNKPWFLLFCSTSLSKTL